jgi:Arc/MetJ family transcription regulator
MKTTIDIPESVLAEAIRHTQARTKREAILTAVARFNQLKRLEALNARIRGRFKDFMTQADLETMREDAHWEGVK